MNRFILLICKSFFFISNDNKIYTYINCRFIIIKFALEITSVNKKRLLVKFRKAIYVYVAYFKFQILNFFI